MLVTVRHFGVLKKRFLQYHYVLHSRATAFMSTIARNFGKIIILLFRVIETLGSATILYLCGLKMRILRRPESIGSRLRG